MLALTAGLTLALWQHQGNDSDAQLPFELMDLDGKLYRASDTLGQVTVLNFWAPWCEPCREEIPLLNQLQGELAPQGLRILGMTEDEPENARHFIQEQPLLYPVLIGLDAILDLQTRYGETRLPYSVIIDRRGQVRYREAGVLTEAEWRERLNPLLAEKMP